MSITNWCIFILWFVFILFWLISGASAKKNISDPSARSGAWVRLSIALFIVVIVQIPAVRQFLNQYAPAKDSPLAWIGVILVFLGIAFAIWARIHLGRNWGMPMSVKEDPELVTTGPYAYVRHPIYTGVLLALVGTVPVIGIIWLVPFVLFGIYFFFGAKKEEELMERQFPAIYPAYKAHTKMLVPFIF